MITILAFELTYFTLSPLDRVRAASSNNVDIAHRESSKLSSKATVELPFINDCKKYLQTFPSFSLLNESRAAIELTVLVEILPTSMIKSQ